METRIKHLKHIKGLELFTDYAIDVNGNVWSFRYNKKRKLKPGWVKKKGGYLFVKLTDMRGHKTSFYVHRLMAMAYLSCDDFSMKVSHINGIQTDNRIENLQWVKVKRIVRDSYKEEVFTLDESISKKIKQVYSASYKKGLKIPDTYQFMNNLIEDALNNYINQYGLRKLMVNEL